MTYVKKGAMIFLVDDDKVAKYVSEGFEVYTPPVVQSPEVTAPSEDAFNCPHCEKQYKSQASLDKHVKEKHPEEGKGDEVDA